MNSSTTSTFISNRFTFNNRRFSSIPLSSEDILHDNQQTYGQQQKEPEQPSSSSPPSSQLPPTRFAFNQLRPSISPIAKRPSTKNQPNVTIDNIKNVYHLTKPLAMKNLRVTQNQMKRITKKYKIERWPYRKVNAMETIHSFLLEEKERSANSNNKEYIDKVDKNIEKLEKMKNEIYNNPNEKYPLLKNKYRLLL